MTTERKIGDEVREARKLARKNRHIRDAAGPATWKDTMDAVLALYDLLQTPAYRVEVERLTVETAELYRDWYIATYSEVPDKVAAARKLYEDSLSELLELTCGPKEDGHGEEK